MAAKPSASKTLTSLLGQEFQNRATNIESACFLKRILQKAEEENKINKPVLEALDRAYFYTGLDKRIFPILKSTDLNITEVKEIERSLIQERLVAFYLNASRLPPRPEMTPTTKNLFAALYGKIPHYVDIRMFRKYLVSMGYVWLRISKGYIVLERPSVTFERYYYLRDIVRYREEDREIFYVDETVLTGSLNYYNFKQYNNLMKTAVKAGISIIQKGLTKSIYAVSKTGVYGLKTVDDFTTSNFASWIINELLPLLPAKSVVVIQKCDHHDDVLKKPTLFSIKTDIIEWLERNNIPYDENMSKCELVDLIDTYTSEADEISRIENTLKINGHELLRLPVCIEDLTPAKHLFEMIKLNAGKVDVDHNEILAKITENILPCTFDQFDGHTAILERDTLHIDIKMDEVFDKVVSEFHNTRLKDNEDSEVPLSDSD